MPASYRSRPSRDNDDKAPTFSMVAKLELIRTIAGLPLPAYETRTLVVLASLINDKTGCAFPPRSLLASLVGIDDRHLGRALKGLQGRGLVAIGQSSGRRRATEYRIDTDAVLAARPSSTGGSSPPLEAGHPLLYGRAIPSSTGGGNPPLEEAQGQLSASEGQPKQQAKLSSASRFARSRSPGARAHAGALADRRSSGNADWRDSLKTKFRQQREIAD